LHPFGESLDRRKAFLLLCFLCFFVANCVFLAHSSFVIRHSDFPVMRLTIVHPCIGRRPGQPYIRTWQMESLPAATLAGLTPRDAEVRFYDDRMEPVPFDEPTDLVAISVETYTARRAYQIATEYRKRRVPVVMGGFHATLCPDEVSRHA